MSPPHRQSVAQISQELGIHQATLYNWRKSWRLQGEVVPASEKDPEVPGVNYVGGRLPNCRQTSCRHPSSN